MARSARIALALLLFAAGCKHEPAVQLPPRVELSLWPVVGVVEFSDTRRPTLGPLATRHFVEMLHAAQPGARVLELGSAQKVLSEIKRTELDFEAVRALGERYKVDAVFLADVAFSEVKPRVAIGQYWDSVSAGASVRGELNTRLYETRSGATLWTRVSSASACATLSATVLAPSPDAAPIHANTRPVAVAAVAMPRPDALCCWPSEAWISETEAG